MNSDLKSIEIQASEILDSYNINHDFLDVSAGFNINEKCLISFKGKTIGHANFLNDSYLTIETNVISKDRVLSKIKE